MLIFDVRRIGSRLHAHRKRLGLTQSEVAERAGISDRTYADIERGAVNMRIETMLRLCRVFGITPDEICTVQEQENVSSEALLSLFETCTQKEKHTMLRLLNVYLNSLK